MIGTEDCELIKFFDWVRWQEKIFPELRAIFHVPNEGRTSQRGGKIKKQKGCRAGVPDVICMIPRAPYGALAIEFKLESGKFTKEQLAMLSLLQQLGYCVRRARTADEGIKILKDYLWPAGVLRLAPKDPPAEKAPQLNQPTEIKRKL